MPPDIIDVDAFEPEEVQCVGATRKSVRTKFQLKEFHQVGIEYTGWKLKPKKKPRKLRAKTVDAIVISSDEESDNGMKQLSGYDPPASDNSSAVEPPAKRIKTSHKSSTKSIKPEDRSDNYSDTDSERDYEFTHAGLDMGQSSNWVPLADRPTTYLDDTLTGGMHALRMSEPDLELVSRHTGRILPPAIQPPKSRLPKKILQDGRHFIWAPAQRVFKNWDQIYGRTAPRSHMFRYLRSLKPRISSDKSAGAITKIAQAGQLVAVASTALEGVMDRVDDVGLLHPYNKMGSLIIWKDGKEIMPSGHMLSLEPNSSEQELRRKYFSVTDVAFSPTRPNLLFSCGMDYRLRVWDCDYADEENDPLRMDREVSYDCGLLNILFKPDTVSELLAIKGSDGYVYLQKQFKRRRGTGYAVAPPDAGHETADMIWGRESTSHMLFASSAPHEPPPGSLEPPRDPVGYHKIFDVNRPDDPYELNAQEAGQAIGLDAAGDKLALATKGNGDSFILRQYDVRRKSSKQTQRIDLEAFDHEDNDPDLHHVQFSPDGNYLAVARSDNATHVYDARFLDRGPLYKFVHQRQDRTGSLRGLDGVTEIQWMQSGPHLGLLTGGVDGCVRVWDVSQASNSVLNGIVIAQTDSEIGSFSLGDLSKREIPIIIGDGGGKLTMYS